MTAASYWNASPADLARIIRERAASVPAVIQPATPATALARPRRKPSAFKGWRAFSRALQAARDAVWRAYGEQWHLRPGACVKARVPAHWVRSVIAHRASNTPRDLNLPAGEFWPDGVLPIDPNYATPFAGFRPRVRLTSLVTGATADLDDLEAIIWLAQQEAIGRVQMKHPRVHAAPIQEPEDSPVDLYAAAD